MTIVIVSSIIATNTPIIMSKKNLPNNWSVLSQYCGRNKNALIEFITEKNVFISAHYKVNIVPPVTAPSDITKQNRVELSYEQ